MPPIAPLRSTAQCPRTASEPVLAMWVTGGFSSSEANTRRRITCSHWGRHRAVSGQPDRYIGVFAAPLQDWNVKHPFGAVGKCGSIAVTEHLIRTLKYEWLRRLPLIRGLGRLEQLLPDFALYYDAWRPHTTLSGAVPDLVHAGHQWSVPPKSASTIPAHIERRFFPGTRVAAFRLAA